MNFQCSTHRSRWLFTPEKLKEIRMQNRQRSVEVIRKLKEESSNTEPDGQQAPAETSEKKKSSGKLKAISVEEELKLLKYYSSKIQELCRAFGFPRKVQATALMFFKRAYLSFSCLDHDPKNIMLTCIYLAGKVEESYIGVDQFCKTVQQDDAVVLRSEVMLLQGLHFDLIVYHPYRAIQGFCLELEGLQEQEGQQLPVGLQGIEGNQLEKIKANAQAAADALMLTDAPLLFPPGQLALAALRSGFKKIEASSAQQADVPFDAFLEHVAQKGRAESGKEASPSSTEAAVSELRPALQSIDALGVEGATPVNADEVKKYDRKLKHCHNLLLDPTSQQYKAAAAAKERKAAQMRDLKMAAREAASIASEARLLGMDALHGDSLPGATHPQEGQPFLKRQRSEVQG